MTLPEIDIARIRRWCRDRVPEEFWDQVRIECDVAERHATIVETRPPWDGSDAPWTRAPIARLHDTTSTGRWTLYWRDRNLKFHRYTDLPPTDNVQALLDHVADSGDPIFFG